MTPPETSPGVPDRPSVTIAEEIRTFRARVQRRLYKEHGTRIEDGGAVITGPGGSLLHHLSRLADEADEEAL